jgi:chromosome segregation ATPase
MNNSKYIQKIKYICCDRYIDSEEKILQLQDCMKISMNPLYVSQIAELNEEIRLLQEQLKMKDETPTVANSVFVKNDEIITKMKERIDDLINHKKDLVKRNTELQEKVDEMQSQYHKARGKLGGLGKNYKQMKLDLDEKDAEIEKLTKELHTLKTKYSKKVKKTGDVGYCSKCCLEKKITNMEHHLCSHCYFLKRQEKAKKVVCQVCSKMAISHLVNTDICKNCYHAVKYENPNIKKIGEIMDKISGESSSKASSKGQDEDSETDSEIYE